MLEGSDTLSIIIAINHTNKIKVEIIACLVCLFKYLFYTKQKSLYSQQIKQQTNYHSVSLNTYSLLWSIFSDWTRICILYSFSLCFISGIYSKKLTRMYEVLVHEIPRLLNIYIASIYNNYHKIFINSENFLYLFLIHTFTPLIFFI